MPPTNHWTKGGSQLQTWSHSWNQCSSLAHPSQKPSRSSAAFCQISGSWMLAFLANSSGRVYLGTRILAAVLLLFAHAISFPRYFPRLSQRTTWSLTFLDGSYPKIYVSRLRGSYVYRSRLSQKWRGYAASARVSRDARGTRRFIRSRERDASIRAVILSGGRMAGLLLEGKKVLVTGVLDRRSIAYSAARLARELPRCPHGLGYT